ncbi:hypothetical protein [Halococcus sp. PRR34]|uniref:hypothetical protein n=1 Tax=Halococcus sp. PRR34 TaxID=3020830 RepID=UPI00235F4C8A|nr:hypothetical protein [Halococcus sp. PRR34]
MPLDNTTKRYDLREERDRLDEKLDELAAQSVELEERFADLQGRAAASDDEEPDDALQRELGQLMQDRESHQGEIGRANRQYNGVLWALDRYGSDQVMTDGGEAEDDVDEDKQEIYDEMTDDVDEESPTDGAGADAPDQRPQEGSSGAQSANGPTQSADSATASADQQVVQGGQPATTGTSEDVTITLGGLTAGEHARVTDRAGDAQAEKSQTVVGAGQQGGSVEGASRVFYCAAGLVDAPFFERGADFESKCEAVREVHPGLMIWIESRIDDVNTPSEDLGNGWGRRLDRARNSHTSDKATSPPASKRSSSN